MLELTPIICEGLQDGPSQTHAKHQQSEPRWVATLKMIIYQCRWSLSQPSHPKKVNKGKSYESRHNSL